ncbi:hypothetical protein T492DRAFT_876531 [Pavlovales sp. CCMP2436]|nr:hypothetical protein T492DRAFT_876531 [Pavlovales sp. CCMP2436]
MSDEREVREAPALTRLDSVENESTDGNDAPPPSPGTALVTERVTERMASAGSATMSALLTRWQTLQIACNCVYDSGLSGSTAAPSATEPPGVKQLLERKEVTF